MLTPRCDRALDRAVQLAEEFQAELGAAYIMAPTDTPEYYLDRSRRSWGRIPDSVERMGWRLRRDLGSALYPIRAIVEEGAPAERLVDLATRENCDLVVTGNAGPESLSRMIIGSTITRLIRGLKLPVLMVHDRSVRSYRNILIATDFSEASLQALQSTAALFRPAPSRCSMPTTFPMRVSSLTGHRARASIDREGYHRKVHERRTY
ncbi:universal stress protein [Novosphingobium sp. JCM 18896]|uniref:universal stress protein n=1 Tax=Novosphingobium sp. JCM 18896 TaxID=2989731 RepID=UPI0039B55311